MIDLRILASPNTAKLTEEVSDGLHLIYLNLRPTGTLPLVKSIEVDAPFTFLLDRTGLDLMGMELLLERSLLDSVEIPSRSTSVPKDSLTLRFPSRVDTVRYEWVGRVLHVDFGIVSTASATRAFVRTNLALWLSDETVVGLTADFSASR